MQIRPTASLIAALSQAPPQRAAVPQAAPGVRPAQKIAAAKSAAPNAVAAAANPPVQSAPPPKPGTTRLLGRFIDIRV
jgi:hypothetical protein